MKTYHSTNFCIGAESQLALQLSRPVGNLGTISGPQEASDSGTSPCKFIGHSRLADSCQF